MRLSLRFNCGSLWNVEERFEFWGMSNRVARERGLDQLVRRLRLQRATEVAVATRTQISRELIVPVLRSCLTDLIHQRAT
jgi:hypothetical protein